jgi:hypothetical protein
MDTQKARGPGKPIDATRRPYQRPSVTWEEDFQPYVFSTCGKMTGQGGACNFHRSS